MDAVEFMDSANILVRDFARQAQFPFEIFLRFGIGSDFGLQNFQRYNFARLQVANLIDNAGPAGADLRHHFVARRNVEVEVIAVPALRDTLPASVHIDFEDVFFFGAPVNRQLVQPAAAQVASFRYAS